MTSVESEGKVYGPCRRCGRLVVSGEARYTLREPKEYEHYDCHDESEKKFRAAMSDFERSARQARTALNALEKVLKGRPRG